MYHEGTVVEAQAGCTVNCSCGWAGTHLGATPLTSDVLNELNSLYNAHLEDGNVG